ncbi:hypothetical protein [Sporosarcina sp. OR05]|uniref:hypothetical protein n=1 Tax=Sporosarcina sp. OR05 TaxID=2969819 RepID=UPI00352A6A69
MKNKRHIIILFTAIVLLIAIFGGKYINNLPKETTWGKMITELFGDKTVIQITITEEKYPDYTTVYITDKQTIKNILEGPAKTKLKESDIHVGPITSKYLLDFRTGYRDRLMYLNENLLEFEGQGISYETDDDSVFGVIHEAFITNNN